MSPGAEIPDSSPPLHEERSTGAPEQSVPQETLPSPVTELYLGRIHSTEVNDAEGAPVTNIPGYELIQELGRGGMGVVYKALQIEVKRLVALKMILGGSQAGSAEVQRFRVEAEAAARLDHLYIVPIYEVGTHEGRHFFSMKLVEGGTLASRRQEFVLSEAAENPSFAEERQRTIARLLAKVAQAVQCAHDNGILHRDLKPGNILLDAHREPHVADFGLAKPVEGGSTLTQTGVIVGTPSYMSPEQAQGKKNLGPAADIYSLGAMLYELLTGRPPFHGDTALDTLMQVTNRDPARPRSVNRAVSRDLETICLKALAKDPERRYRSAGELADDLQRFAEGQPIKARPAGWVERAWRRCRRNPVVSGLSAAVLTLLLAFAVLLGYVFKPAPNPDNDGSLDRIKAAGTMVIAVDTNYPPMEFLKDGRLAGFDVDLARQVAARLGVEPVLKVVHWDWPEVPAGLNAGQCDMVISSWTITSQRQQEAAFVEYLRTVQVFACKRGTMVQTEHDLAGKIVVVGRDTVQHRFLKSVVKKGIAIKEIKVLNGGEDPFPIIKKGLAEVTIIDEPVGRYQARQDSDVVVTGSLGHAMDPDAVGMVFRKQDRQLQQAVAEALRSLKDDGSYGRILGEWFGK
jgi:serine/threonine protein kinase/ABC-type amino acid transport substrate-binding protein